MLRFREDNNALNPSNFATSLSSRSEKVSPRKVMMKALAINNSACSLMLDLIESFGRWDVSNCGLLNGNWRQWWAQVSKYFASSQRVGWDWDRTGSSYLRWNFVDSTESVWFRNDQQRATAAGTTRGWFGCLFEVAAGEFWENCGRLWYRKQIWLAWNFRFHRVIHSAENFIEIFILRTYSCCFREIRNEIQWKPV